MAKKIFKSMILGIVVFLVAILVGYLSYTAAYRKQTEEMQEQIMSENMVSAASVSSDRESGETIRVSYYLARLENDDIAIYMVTEEDAKFLYRLDIYTGNFPAEELLRLRDGVELRTRQELMEFEEDYTS